MPGQQIVDLVAQTPLGQGHVQHHLPGLLLLDRRQRGAQTVQLVQIHRKADGTSARGELLHQQIVPSALEQRAGQGLRISLERPGRCSIPSHPRGSGPAGCSPPAAAQRERVSGQARRRRQSRRSQKASASGSVSAYAAGKAHSAHSDRPRLDPARQRCGGAQLVGVFSRSFDPAGRGELVSARPAHPTGRTDSPCG